MTDTRSSLSKDRLRVWLRLIDAHAALDAAVRDRLRADHGSTLPRFDVLSALERHPDGLRMSELSQKLRVSNGNVTGIVERLVKEGVVDRVPLPDDRRATLVRLNGSGRARFAAMAAAHEGWIDDLLSSLDSAEIATLNDLLGRIAGRGGALPA